MVYKRVNKSLKSDSKVEYVESNNQGIYINTSITGANFAPYHGIYIYQEPKKDTIYLSKMIENIQIGHEKFDIIDVKTSETVHGGVQFLTEFTNDPVPTYIYDVNGCIIEKKYKLHVSEKILCIDYKVTNNTGKQVKITVSPCVTNRGLFVGKRQSDMKFTTLVTSNATKIALSISEKKDLYIKSPNMKYDKRENYLSGVNCDFEMPDGTPKTYVEDLFIPGSFEGSVKTNNTNTFSIFVAMEDIDLRQIKSYDIEVDIKQRDEYRYGSIDKNYHELFGLAKTAYNLHYVDRVNRRLVLLESVPGIYDTDEYVKNIIVSMEGNYLLLKRYKEAHRILESMMLKLKDETYKLSDLDRCEAMLLFIEALNRYLMESEADSEEIRVFYEYIKSNIYEYLDKKNKEVCADQDFLLKVNSKKYIKINSLWYNALRIFVDLADKFHEESEFIYTISESLRENIVASFWDDAKNVLKYEVEETAYATFDMIYALSLSYPVLKDSAMSMKLMDTAFKELYTAYGMRLGSVNTKQYDGHVYPHLMVHFLKANLRQMGVTRASQKLAYNLVKEVLGEIGKNTVGTVKYRYNEKLKKAFGYEVSGVTNAELIRAFDMLT